MSQNFVACDRDQAFLMPPSLMDWVPDDHLVWTVLGAVDQMDLDAVYGKYRANGQGRAAYDPAMMVALLLYSYSVGNRSSRGIERACRVDVAYKVITAMAAPDHSTIAEFRRRHETALGELFVDVLRLCREAGLVSVGVIAIDGTKIKANASRDRNGSYESIVGEILDEAEQTDRDEDEQHGPDRGDELPERFRSRESRRAALAEARERLEQQRASEPEAETPAVEIEIDEQRVVAEGHGRKGWLREGRRQLEQRREREQRPIPRSRADRLIEAKQRLEEAHAVELAANQAFEAHHHDRLRSDGRRFAPPRPLTMPVLPEGRVNVVDPDSRVMRTVGQPTIQGYNAQAAVTAGQVILAAEITIESPDFGHLEPVFNAALRELQLAGVNERPGVVVADAGYWHKLQMESIVSDATQVLIPPDSSLKEGPRPGWTGGLYDFMRRVLATEHGHAIYRQRQETIEPMFGHTKHNRGFRQFQRRGRSAVRSEWRFIAATHNLVKLHNHWIAADAA
jgi:transposase